jgi:hypothetical protein
MNNSALVVRDTLLLAAPVGVAATRCVRDEGR